MAKSKLTDDLLLQVLVERGLAAATDLQQLLTRQKEAFNTFQEKIAGVALLVDMTKGELVFRDYPTERELKRVSLGGSHQRLDEHDWERWGSHSLIADSEEGNRLSEFNWQLNALYGLVLGPNQTYLYNEGRLNTDYLAASQHAIFGGIAKGKLNHTPFDLYLSNNRRWLCVVDRGAGSVHIIDVPNQSLKGTVNIREAGRTHTINIAINEARELVYLTDNQTASLHVINLNTLELSRERVGLGILGNLQLAPDGEHLYILSIKPNEALSYVKLDTWEAEKTIKLKGQLFKADSSDPCDVMSLSPDGQQLLVMSYLNDPNPFTPMITVIDAKQGKTLKRYSLKDGVKPFQIVYSLKNPVKSYTKNLEELIIDSGLIDARTLWMVKRELKEQLGEDFDDDDDSPKSPKEEDETSEDAEDEQAEVNQEEEASEDVTETENDEEETLEEAQEEEVKQPEPPAEDDEFLDVQQIHIAYQTRDDSDKTLNFQPKKANKIVLPPEAVKEIMDILVTTFQKQVGEDIEDYPDVMERLRLESEKVRKELEDYDSTVVQIDALFEGKSLQTAVIREAILMMLDLRETVKTTQIKTVPSNCPNCKQSLLGAWDCPACGFEVESPDRAFKRRIASAEATANLPLGNFVIPDPQGLRLLQLNPYKYVVWNLDPDQLSADYPIDALWLPNNNVLMVDREGHQVMELGNRGKIFWRVDTTASARHVLKEPVKVTYYIPVDESFTAMKLLIVDQGNHRILEINRRQQISMEFGVMGEAGAEDGKLNSPSDVQFTHDETYLITDTGNNRVLELDKRGNIERIFGEELKLKKPTSAQRLFNDHTLIVDSGNYRLIELDPSGQILHETLYYSKGMDVKYRVVSPIKMIRLINKDILILDEDKLIQVRLQQNNLVWYSMIEDLAYQPKVDEPETFIDENGVEHRVYKMVDHGHIKPARLSQKINFKRMQKLIEARMRGETIIEIDEEGKSVDAVDRLRALIEDRKLEQKRNLQKELSLDTFQPSEIFEKEGAEVLGLRIYCLDRNHNAIIRINRKGEVKWHYGFEMGQSLSRPYYLSETKRTLLISDTGHNRVIELSKADKDTIMEFKGSATDPLSGPRSAIRLSMGRTLIADQRKKRIVEFNAKGDISWEFSKSGQISSPQYAEELENGNILFADSMLNSIREVDRNGNLVWSYGSRIKGNGPGQLFAPEFATRLATGNTLIADTRNNRVLEVTMEGREIWIYSGDPRSRRKILNPVRVERLENGNTMITYNNHREMIEVAPNSETIWYFRMGNDVFLPPVSGSDGRGQKQLVEKLTPYYNPIEKRLIKSAESKGMGGFEANITLMDNCQMKSVRASLILMRLEQFGTVIKTFPSPEELLADKFGKQIIVALILDPGHGPDAVGQELCNLAEVEETSVTHIKIDEPATAASSVVA